MHTVYNNTHNTCKNEYKHSEMGTVRQNPILRTVSLFICVCIALCTLVAHNIAQISTTVTYGRLGLFGDPSRRGDALTPYVFKGQLHRVHTDPYGLCAAVH